MKKLNIKLPKDVVEYLRVLRSIFGKSFDVYLGGGFLRDLYTGRHVPKDLDIFLVPNGTLSDHYDYVRAYKDGLEQINDDVYMCHHMVVGDYLEDMAIRGVSRVMMGFCTLCGFESQIIMYNRQLSLEEMTLDFDFTINQVVQAPDNEIYCSDDFIVDHECRLIHQTHVYGAERMTHRLERMVAKYGDYEITMDTLLLMESLGVSMEPFIKRDEIVEEPEYYQTCSLD